MALGRSLQGGGNIDSVSTASDREVENQDMLTRQKTTSSDQVLRAYPKVLPGGCP